MVEKERVQGIEYDYNRIKTSQLQTFFNSDNKDLKKKFSQIEEKYDVGKYIFTNNRGSLLPMNRERRRSIVLIGFCNCQRE